MMLSGGLVASTFLIYIACLFAIAFWGARQTGEFGPRLRVWVYSLSIAVWCTSWTFFGAVGMAAGQIWDFLPIYIGPIILCFFGWRLIARMLAISKQENITSIADFIASRYGKSQGLGVIRSEEHTSELQSRPHLVCRLLLEKKKKHNQYGQHLHNADD